MPQVATTTRIVATTKAHAPAHGEIRDANVSGESYAEGELGREFDPNKPREALKET